MAGKKKEEKKEQVADYNRVVEPIENHILTVRGVQVILDRDLADLYDITIPQRSGKEVVCFFIDGRYSG